MGEGASVTLKLLIDTHGKRVVFAECGKDFLNLLNCVLCLPLPIAAVVGPLMRGSLANLHQSIENLNKTGDMNATTVKKFYSCIQCRDVSRVSDDPRAVCPDCNSNMTKDVSYVAPPTHLLEQGTVKYMVTDDLVVTPSSTISILETLKRLNVKEVSALEEKVVQLRVDEFEKLVDASLQSNEVLTDIFLKNTESEKEAAAFDARSSCQLDFKFISGGLTLSGFLSGFSFQSKFLCRK